MADEDDYPVDVCGCVYNLMLDRAEQNPNPCPRYEECRARHLASHRHSNAEETAS